MCKSIMSLSKIAHQMWHDHPFSQRSKTTERAVGWEYALKYILESLDGELDMKYTITSYKQEKQEITTIANRKNK